MNKCKIYIPFTLEFHIFLIDISEIQVDFTINDNYFEKIEWFDLNQLPHKTHMGMLYSLWRFGFSFRRKYVD